MKTALVRQRNLPWYLKKSYKLNFTSLYFSTEFYKAQYNIWDMTEITLCCTWLLLSEWNAPFTVKNGRVHNTTIAITAQRNHLLYTIIFF